MINNDIQRYIAIGKEVIIYNRDLLNADKALKIRYKINNDEREIRLYDVPKILDFQEKSIIYFALLERYYFPTQYKPNENGIENYVVKENGYTYHQFNNIEGESKGILGELLFEIPRQKDEDYKLSRMRDIYEMLLENIDSIGEKPICINVDGTVPDFKDIYRVVIYILKRDDKISKRKGTIKVFKRMGMFGGNKRIFIIPRSIVEKVLKKK